MLFLLFTLFVLKQTNVLSLSSKLNVSKHSAIVQILCRLTTNMHIRADDII